MKHVTASLLVLFVIGLMIPNAFAENIPEWVKNAAGWWATNQIDDSSFLQGIQYLIKEGIMVISHTETSESTGSQEVPSWIKNNAGWWADGQIDDNSFVSGIQWLISNGIIVVEEKLIHTDADFRVAFIGDQGLGPNAIAVLNLIKDEGAQMVLHQGDFDYQNDPDKWDRQISDVLGSDFPYFASVGNHDMNELSGYQEKLYDRLKKIPDAVCNGDLGVKSSCTYEGLFFILAAPGLIDSGYDSFIEKQLNGNDFMWRICSWHYAMESLKPTIKPNETGWEVYESCKNGGAIIANGHLHSYQRTKTLINFENQNVDSEWSKPNKLRVKEGATFSFISGLGGMPTTKHGSEIEWTTSYTRDPGAPQGALFCTFNVGGQPNKAYCYFKNNDGRIIDAFTITSFLGTYPDNINLIDADMSGWDLTGDDFSNKVIIDANLSNTVFAGADLSNAVLIGTTIIGADLTDANLTGVILNDKDLTGTILRGADLTDASLTGVDLTDKDLTGTILRGADFSNSILTGVDLSGKDLTGTILRGMDFTDKDLTGTILRGADFSNSILTGVNLSGKDLTGTILRGMDFTDKDLTGIILNGADLTGAILTGVDLSGKDLTGTILTGADLTDAILPNSALTDKNFQKTVFDGVDLSGKDLSESIFYLNNFVDANLENANLTSADFIEVDFTKIKNKSLAGADLSEASFAHSNLSGVNLAGTILHTTNFWKADLSGVDFTVTDSITDGLTFIDANLSNSNFEGVDLSPKEQYFQVFQNKAHLKNLPHDLLVKNLISSEHQILIISTEVSGNDLAVNYVFFNSFARANLENANFKNASLWHANFYSADIANADLSGADLRNAFLGGADLSNANLEGANLQDVYIDENTILKCLNHPICLDE